MFSFTKRMNHSLYVCVDLIMSWAAVRPTDFCKLNESYGGDRG